MKVKALLLAVLSGFVLSSAAQEYQPQVGFSTEKGYKTNFKKNKAKDNWFISIAGAFKAFDIPFALTDGGPFGTTQTIALNIYQEAFIRYRMGMGSAKSVVLFLLVAIVTIVQLRITSKKEVEY